MLLSAFEYLTDGYDFLFLIINNIIGKYNDFVSRMNEEIKKISQFDTNGIQTGIESIELHPRALFHGSVGGLSILSLKFISSPSFMNLVDSFRYTGQNEYDFEKLHNSLLDKLSHPLFRPTIKNPTSHLRSKFRFCNENIPSIMDSSIVGGILSSCGSFHFVHVQDLNLFEDCKQSIENEGLPPQNDHSVVKRSFLSKFYDMEYENLRSMLQGVMTLLNHTFISTNISLNKCKTIGDCNVNIKLREYGFPELSESQIKFILSLDLTYLAGMVQFLGYQLASEAYLGNKMPLAMNMHLNEDSSKVITTAILQMCNKKGKQETVKALEEFTVDVMSFYETEICKRGVESNENLKSYLSSNNFCDESDVIFNLLPDDITIRHYVPLRQHFHQLKLSILAFNERDEDMIPVLETGDPSYIKPIRGQCWLWKREIATAIRECVQQLQDYFDDDSTTSDDNSSSGSQELWFEKCLKKDDTVIVVDTTRDNMEDEISVENTNSQKVNTDSKDSTTATKEEIRQDDDKLVENSADNSLMRLDDEFFTSLDNVYYMSPNNAATVIQQYWKKSRCNKERGRKSLQSLMRFSTSTVLSLAVLYHFNHVTVNLIQFGYNYLGRILSFSFQVIDWLEISLDIGSIISYSLKIILDYMQF